MRATSELRKFIKNECFIKSHDDNALYHDVKGFVGSDKSPPYYDGRHLEAFKKKNLFLLKDSYNKYAILHKGKSIIDITHLPIGSYQKCEDAISFSPDAVMRLLADRGLLTQAEIDEFCSDYRSPNKSYIYYMILTLIHPKECYYDYTFFHDKDEKVRLFLSKDRDIVAKRNRYFERHNVILSCHVRNDYNELWGGYRIKSKKGIDTINKV